MQKLFLVLFCFIFLPLFNSGCGTAYKVAMDERNIRTQASDEKITMAIRKKILDDNQVKFLDISTYVYNGHVYLVGEYEDSSQKTQAIKLAKEVENVKSVKSHFLPKRKGDLCGTTDNIELSTRVKAKLIKDKDISSTNIEVKSLQCHIILLGLVGSKNQIRKAVAHAKKVDGVRSVVSYLKAVK